MFRIAICEETPYAAEHMEKLLRELGYAPIDQLIIKFMDTRALAHHIETVKGQIDILLLNVMPDPERSIEVAARIGDQYPHIKTILITGSIEYASMMMEARPICFLTKPIEKAALAKAMTAAQNALLHEPSDMITITVRGRMIDISTRDIHYLSSSKGTVTMHGYSGVHTVYATLKEIADRLPSIFCHCHKGFIVNLGKVKSMDKKQFHLVTGQTIPIGKTKYQKVRAQFVEWLG